MTLARLLAFAAATLLALPAVAQKGTLVRAPDHVLVWAQTPGAGERLFEDLGFTVRKGQVYPEGITASTVVFGDWSYLELVHFSDPAKAAGSAQARAELDFVAQGPGASSFAIQVEDIGAASDFLKQQGFQVGDATPDMVDPDGPLGPKPPQPASWRDFHFAASPVAGVELFFIQYPPEPPASAEDEARFRARSTHPNGARRLSAIWLLVPDLEAEAAVYQRMGFTIGPAVDVPHLNTRARIARLASGAVILAQSAQLPAEFRAPARPGPRVIGLSFEVGDIAATRSWLSQRGKHVPRSVEGLLGPALLLPLPDALGMFVAFHAPAPLPK